jgi:hypothetical protein
MKLQRLLLHDDDNKKQEKQQQVTHDEEDDDDDERVSLPNWASCRRDGRHDHDVGPPILFLLLLDRFRLFQSVVIKLVQQQQHTGRTTTTTVTTKSQIMCIVGDS